MAVRTTLAAVGKLIELDVTIDMTPFIETASALVTKHCAERNTDYTVTELELIERWLSAHCYAMRDPRTSSESAGGVSASYQSSIGLGFDLTHYGQMAMRLDYSGGLAALNAQVKQGDVRTPSLSWLGTART